MRSIILCIVLTLIGSVDAYALEVSTTFSSKEAGGTPVQTKEREFTCSDTIYALIHAKGLSGGVHDIEIHWLDPRGKRQELTQFQAYASDTDELIWGWLRLHPPQNSGLVRAYDPSHGMRTFIGMWTVKINIDGKQVSTARFEVLC